MKSDIIEELFRQHYNDALLYVLSISKNKTISEDIVSEAFFKALCTSDEVTNFKAWLFTVCRNMYFNESRRYKYRAELTDDMAEERESLIEEIIREDDYRALYRAIGLLPQIQTEVITLFYFEGQSIRDIAFITDKTEDNVKVILYRARENLRKILGA